jgi:hypothetical protein
MMVAMPVFNALLAGCRAAELAVQVTFQSSSHCPVSTSSGLDAILLEELDGTPSHATAEHYVSILLVDEAWYLTWLVGSVIRISDHFHTFHICFYNIDEGKKRAAPKVMCDHAI